MEAYSLIHTRNRVAQELSGPQPLMADEHYRHLLDVVRLLDRGHELHRDTNAGSIRRLEIHLWHCWKLKAPKSPSQ